MAPRINRLAAIHTLVVSLTGMLMTAVVFWGFIHLSSAQREVGDNALALQDLRRLEDSITQWLLMNDLVYGSGETYLIEGARGLGIQVKTLVEKISEADLAASSATELDTLKLLMQNNERRLDRAALVSTETEVEQASQLLSEWDTASLRAVEIIELMSSTMLAKAETHRALLAERRSLLATLGILLAGLYVGLVLVMWRWVGRVIVSPLQALTQATRRALIHDEPVELVEQGPFEVRQLAHSASAFVSLLEQRVAERTRALASRETALMQEVKTRRAAQEAAAQAQAVAEAANEAKGVFLATMSHEIRTPLNGILGGAELARREAADPEQQETLQTILDSGEQLLGVINDILDFSKLDAGYMELSLQSFDLHDVLKAVVEMFLPLAREKGLSVYLLTEVDVPRKLQGDSLRIRQVLANLLGNAVKFTDAGHIHLRTSLAATNADRATIRFEVADSGVGFDPELKEALFEPFQQEDGTTTRSKSGTGLGLSISRHFVELMNGEIGAHGEPGVGASFWCTMDLEIAHPISTRQPLQRDIAVSISDPLMSRYVMDLLHQWECRSVAEETADLVLTDSASSSTSTGAGRTVCVDSAARGKPLLPDQLYDMMAGNHDGPGAAAVIDDNPTFDLRVLVVEDNPVNQMVAGKMLNSLGCSVALADDGAAGVEAVQQQSFDLILMDWHMPNMDGLEATRRVRDWETNSHQEHVPIYALTANAMAGDEETCIAAGMDGYLSKPLSRESLANALKNLV